MRVVALDQLQQFTAVQLLSDPGAIGGPVIVPQCAQIVINWGMEDGKTGVNVLYGRYAGAFHGTQAEANAIKTALTTGAQWTTLAGFLGVNTFFGALTIRDVNTAGGPLISSNTAIAPGTSASPSLPNEVALVITHRTALAGRANRGRTYVPGWATNALGAGNVGAAAAITALGNWASTLSTALAGSGYTLVIGQKARAQYTGSTGTVHAARSATSQPVTSSIVRDNHWDTQRRRGLK